MISGTEISVAFGDRLRIFDFASYGRHGLISGIHPHADGDSHSDVVNPVAESEAGESREPYRPL